MLEQFEKLQIWYYGPGSDASDAYTDENEE